jgi:gliding motility-associated-like protein
MILRTVMLCLFVLSFSNLFSQTFVYAQLTGNPVNTSGWNVTGNASVGDTDGDADTFTNELILTPNDYAQSGGVFWGQAILPSECNRWAVDFEFRIFEGSNADGIAFCFLDVPPAGFVSGGGVGIPGTANGLKVVIDPYDNGCGDNPELQILNAVGYDECDPAMVKVQNVNGNLEFLRSNAYQPARITYDNGVIKLYINGTLYLTTTSILNFAGYIGFTSSTGGASDLHSIRNATIYTDQPFSNAGPDLTICAGDSATLGGNPVAGLAYNWLNASWLSDDSIANPSFLNINSTNLPLVYECIISAYDSVVGPLCPSYDTVLVTLLPTYIDTATVNSCTPIFFNNTLISTSGTYEYVDQSINGCDSIKRLVVTFYPKPIVTVTENLNACIGIPVTLTASGAQSYSWSNGVNQGESFVPTSSGIYTVIGTDQNGCKDTSATTINLQNNVDVQFTADTLSGQPALQVNFENLTLGTSTYIWNFGNGSIIDANTNASQSTVYNSPGVYDVILTGQTTSCSGSDTITIIVFAYDDPVIVLPNIFTPNNDNVNDFFYIETTNCKEISIQIFNRWGEKINALNTLTEKWDGTINGAEATDGVYFYNYLIQDSNGKIIEGQSFVELIR